MGRRSQTSDRISSLAARYIRLGGPALTGLTPKAAEERARDIRSLAASLLRQDEVKGLRGMVRKVFGG